MFTKSPSMLVLKIYYRCIVLYITNQDVGQTAQMQWQLFGLRNARFSWAYHLL